MLGVLPYLHGLQLEAEDGINRDVERDVGKGSQTSSFPRRREFSGVNDAGSTPLDSRLRGNDGNRLRVITPVTPRISNHTDFDALRQHPQVDFRFIGPDEDIPAADLIILPGSKAVRADLAFLQQQGWDVAISRHLRFGGKLIGICGGFQMLGRELSDPLGLEGAAGSSAGLGWLDMTTELMADKQLRNVRGVLSQLLAHGSADPLLLPLAPMGEGDTPQDKYEDIAVAGYEIHAGVTQGLALERPALHLEHGSDGAISEDNQVLGTYLHGVFDTAAACDALLVWAGLVKPESPDLGAMREASIERLADMVAEHMDTGKLTAILNESVERCA